ncbi:hydantoinase/oxoprolinase family protein [Paraconexibacter antarcticus]|uniref:Hydantoinase/oxoprolinase family protein n=1 Tax=Paraconexibacter antarcticus TaxID=2949664 RepID=A0ABY5E1B9_9ACTN|nr:hydantoinase/oxoprolinase family protein [Paraconexibacter antarcticus]UTI66962.1 hydantoinase/oxoprolinase family protein [Paraconexibacter antarcticus]
MLLGVDVGGTFTDAVLVSGGRVWTAKAPSTPEDQSAGVLAAIEAVLGDAGAAPGDVRSLAHGMTVATNALLEGRSARTALLVTAGFTDVVALGRQARPELYRLQVAAPPPLVPAERRIAVPERTGPDGVLRALTDAAAAEVAEAVAALDVESVAVGLLHADRHPGHERLLGDALRARLGDDVHLSLSHEVVGTFREAERLTTTEVDAALSPLLARYLRALLAGAATAGLPEPLIMQSSGGLTDAAAAAAHAAFTVLSGPAGGAAAAQLLARESGLRDLVCFDMGGTSCDVCVVQDGRVRQSAGREVGGRHLALPMVDIHTVGAGGGSIAWVDPGGALRAGPRSAGARPGPACFGHGGTEPTVTDAHVVLGAVTGTLPGGIPIDAGAARIAVATLGAALGTDDVEEIARGIVAVADAEMLGALRVMTVQQGVDPRDFTLLAFGGAGGLHACALAEALEMRRVMVPAAAGVLSALGLAAADQRRDEARTVMLRGDGLTAEALRAAAGSGAEVAWEARYAGQSHELTLEGVAPDPGAIADALRRVHEERYGFAPATDAAVEVVTVRRTVRTPGPELTLATGSTAAPGDAGACGPRTIALPGATFALRAGWRITGDTGGWIVAERDTDDRSPA